MGKIPANLKNLKVRVMIREYEVDFHTFVKFEIEDEGTGFQFLSMVMKPDSFVKCLVSNGIGYADAKVVPEDVFALLGRKMKSKVVKVAIPKKLRYDMSDEQKEAFIKKIKKEYNAYGVRDSDLTNPHYFSHTNEKGESVQNVAIYYFDDEETKDV